VLRATKVAEEAGVPAVAIVSSGFMGQAKAVRNAIKAPDLSLAEYPGVIPMDSADQLADKVWNNVLPAVLEHLSTDVVQSAAASAEPGLRDVVFSGTLDEVQEHFHAREWSDGMAFVPPTRERIEAFLRWTDRHPDEVIGVLPAEYREATVWSVAVNGVMAGCRPEYMPILLAAVDAIADPQFRLEDAGSTPGWEPMITLSGELADALGFNTEAGNMRVGRRPNTSIGRFLKLYFRNVAGLRPGGTDKGSIGLGFNVVMAENEQAVKELGWTPHRVDRGFAAADNVVTVRSVMAISTPIYSGGTDPLELAWPLVNYMAETTGPWFFSALIFAQWHPLIQMSPAVATGFAQQGWGKQEIRRHLFENVKLSARSIERSAFACIGNRLKIPELAQRGAVPPAYTQSDDPERLVPLLLREEWTDIVLAGDPGRNQSKIYFNNQEQGPPISRKVQMPPDWRERIFR
jgi:hypothetical protein